MQIINFEGRPYDGVWHAIKLTSGALYPAKRYYVEVTERKTRYLRHEELSRCVIVEALDKLDVEYYIPVEKRLLIHHKTKKQIERISPLIPGYGFVRNVADYEAVSQANGVIDIMRASSVHMPFIIPAKDILDLIAEEEKIEDAFQRQKQRNAMTKNKNRRNIKNLYPSGKSFVVKSGHILAGQRGKIDGHTGRAAIKSMMQMLGGLVETELTVDQIELVDDNVVPLHPFAG